MNSAMKWPSPSGFQVLQITPPGFHHADEVFVNGGLER